MNGLRGASVLLHLNESFEQLVSEIEWTFQTETSGAHLVAEFRNGQWKRFNSSFGTRLEPVEKTVLKIRDLEAEDGGVYEAQVTLRTALRTEDKDQVKLRIEEHTFRLVIYEPVPEPKITPQMISDTPHGCNVSLQCQAFGKGGFNISWEMGIPPSTLESNSDWYQLSANGSELRVSWRPSFSDANLTCRASNPVDQKRVSFDFRGVCSSEGGNQPRRKWPVLIILCILVLVLIVLGGVWLLKRIQTFQPPK